ncbi:hypothetical protein [Dethiothermospora halolimnae]|uniref:hypothetical protein n=1 Tax=Dethiothermospora halolimnae TaxID=3114390 RepID=UPI003CCBB6FC
MNNCFLLLIPILIWNLIFTPKLTGVGYMVGAKDIKSLKVFEEILRMAIFIIPLFMRFDTFDKYFKNHIYLFFIGVVIYFGSWLMIIYFPNSCWSTSMIGLLAPGYTPLIWLIGIGLLGNFKAYNYLAVLFIAIHVLSSYFKLKGV